MLSYVTEFVDSSAEYESVNRMLSQGVCRCPSHMVVDARNPFKDKNFIF